jgi:hypothetical protein
MKKGYIICILLFAGALSSCKKALTEKPYDFISPNNFYKDANGAVAAINGVYSTFWGWGLLKQPYWLTGLDCDYASGADWFMGNIGAGNPQGYWGIDNIWNDHFLMISRANNVLYRIPGVNMDKDLKNRILGEAYFLRGWAYFDLVRLYGGVPLREITLAQGGSPNEPRASVAETFNFIISDFKKAEQLLFLSSDSRSGEKGRVTKGVARAYLAKTYLTMASGSLKDATVTVRGGKDNGYYSYNKDVVAGYEGFDSKLYFDSARMECLKIIKEGEYSLFPHFMDLWQIANRNRQEWMWEIQALQGNENVETDLNYYFTAAKDDRSNIGAVWMSTNLYNNYEDQDDRILYGVRHQYIVDYGNPQNTSYVFYPQKDQAKYETDAQGHHYSYSEQYNDKAYSEKFRYVTDSKPQNNDVYFPMLRYADILLMYAEAENEISGPDADAYHYLNIVRERSHATDAPSGMNKQQFRSYVLEERGREFVFEAKRRYDLLRWGIYLPVMNQIGVNKDNISKVRTKRNLLFPIPTSEINSNKDIKANNPGW